MEDFGRHGMALGGFGRFWDVLDGFWKVLVASVRLCKALDALEGFGGFSSLWQVWKALGSFDVNMVCPFPGWWINHVLDPFPGCLCVVGLRP